jgi:hypothetical protein
MERSDRRTWPRFLKAAVINLFVLGALLELVSVAFYFYSTGEFFYTRRTGLIKAPLAAPLRRADNDMSVIYQLHPYFGFVYRQGYLEGTYPTNNYGFLSRQDFPFMKRTKDQFIVGLFGGSVATLFSFYELENHGLVDALRRSPYFAGKDIVVLNFAAGGYKQPQQLLVLNYLLAVGQAFDMVINIDGFNETALAYWNNRFGVDISMAPVHVLLPLADLANQDLSLDGLSLSLEILRLKDRLREAPIQLDKSRLATSYALRWVHMQYLARQYHRKRGAFSVLERRPAKDALVYVNRLDKPLDDTQAYERMAAIWANASLAMKGLLSAKGIEYYHVIQPNQYYATGRQFTTEETRTALNDGSPNRESVQKGYPRLLARLRGLEDAGVNIFSAVEVFDGAKDTIYVDDCCHYNTRGNEILARYIARRILERMSVSIRPPRGPR